MFVATYCSIVHSAEISFCMKPTEMSVRGSRAPIVSLFATEGRSYTVRVGARKVR